MKARLQWLVVLMLLMAGTSYAQCEWKEKDENGKTVTRRSEVVKKCDDRPDFEINGYIATAIDSFAAQDLKKYLNPEDSGEIRFRGIGGFDFAYRVAGTTDTKNQLWVYGETVHGVRSADVECSGDNAKIPPCKDAFIGAQLAGNLTSPGTQTLYMLRNATSLEAFMGVRYEFLTVRPGSNTRANLYFKGQAGFLTVAKNGQDVVDLHHYGVGLIATTGDFTGSYVEVGRGRSDIFHDNKRSRTKIDGYATWKMTNDDRWGGIQPFIQITVDADLGYGADSVQNYFGLQFDVKRLFKPN